MPDPALASIGRFRKEAPQMRQIDPSVSPDTSTPGDPRPPSLPQEPHFNWRVSVAMFAGLAILLATLFGLRALRIFPSEPGQDPEIVAARATQAALGTQQALAPRPTVATTSAPVATPTGAAATALPTSVARPTAARIPTAATQPSTGQQPAPTTAQAPQTSATVAVATTQPSVVTPQATTPPTAEVNPIDVQAEATPVQAAIPADLAAAIVQGYSNYWTVRVNALHAPDPSNADLQGVMASTELSRAQQVLGSYQEQGMAYQSNVKHQIWITQASPDAATVVDRYVATSTRVDPSSLEPLDPSVTPNVENLTTTFSLQNIDGTWKVVDQVGGG